MTALLVLTVLLQISPTVTAVYIIIYTENIYSYIYRECVLLEKMAKKKYSSKSDCRIGSMWVGVTSHRGVKQA